MADQINIDNKVEILYTGAKKTFMKGHSIKLKALEKCTLNFDGLSEQITDFGVNYAPTSSVFIDTSQPNKKQQIVPMT